MTMASVILFARGDIAARWNSWGAGSDGSGPHYEVTFAKGERARFYATKAEAVRAAKRAAAKIFPNPKRLAAEFTRQLFAKARGGHACATRIGRSPARPSNPWFWKGAIQPAHRWKPEEQPQ
jgi:hypothetical protein